MRRQVCRRQTHAKTWQWDGAPEMRNNLPNHSQVHNGGYVDDDQKRGAVSEMKQDLLNYCQVRDGAWTRMWEVLCPKW